MPCRGATPLYVAAQNGHQQCIDALLKGGASVDLANNDGPGALEDGGGAARCEERDGNGFDGGKVVSVLSVLDLFGRFARSWWGSIYMDLLELLVQIGTFRK